MMNIYINWGWGVELQRSPSDPGHGWAVWCAPMPAMWHACFNDSCHPLCAHRAIGLNKTWGANSAAGKKKGICGMSMGWHEGAARLWLLVAKPITYWAGKCHPPSAKGARRLWSVMPCRYDSKLSQITSLHSRALHVSLPCVLSSEQ